MPVVFSQDWAQEIADISTQEEYQNAEITIIDPSLIIRTGSITTGYEYDASGANLWSGQARVAGMRASVGAGGTTSTNPTKIKSIRIQIPYDRDFGRVLRGWQVRVTNGGRNAQLESYLFAVESDVNSSHMAALTFECTVDVESNPNWQS